MDLSTIFDINIFKNNPDGGKQISNSEVFSIWNALRTRYVSMSQYNFLINFVHDKDFSLIINNILNDINEQINLNENLRNLFLDLLKNELNILDSYLRYGKLKGWTHIPPTYNKTN